MGRSQLLVLVALGAAGIAASVHQAQAAQLGRCTCTCQAGRLHPIGPGTPPELAPGESKRKKPPNDSPPVAPVTQ